MKNKILIFLLLMASNSISIRATEKEKQILKEDINAQDKYGQTALMRACFARDKNKVKELLEAGADPNITTPDNQTALTKLYAKMRNPDPKMVEMLLQAGADPDIYENWSNTPLMMAIARANIPVVKMLLNAHANVNVVIPVGSANDTALVYAIEAASPKMVKLLLNSGADPNLGNDMSGRTVLQMARREGYKEIVDALLTKNAH